MEQIKTYTPTASERKILEVLANPENATLNISEICKKAGVSRQTYYRAFEKKEFVTYYHNLCRQMIAESVGPIIRACEKEAKKGSFQHAKLLLEMAGLYTEKKKYEHTGADGGPIKIELAGELDEWAQ